MSSKERAKEILATLFGFIFSRDSFKFGPPVVTLDRTLDLQRREENNGLGLGAVILEPLV